MSGTKAINASALVPLTNISGGISKSSESKSLKNSIQNAQVSKLLVDEKILSVQIESSSVEVTCHFACALKCLCAPLSHFNRAMSVKEWKCILSNEHVESGTSSVETEQTVSSQLFVIWIERQQPRHRIG